MSRKVLLLGVSVVLLPAVMAFLEVQATGAPPPQPPAAPKVTATVRVGGERAILEELKKPTSVEFVKTPLQDVVAYLQDLHHIPIFLDRKELGAMKIDPAKSLVDCRLEGIPLRSALRLMLDEMGLKFVIHNDVLLITSPTKVESEEFIATKVYPVSDLVIPMSGHGYTGSSMDFRPAQASQPFISLGLGGRPGTGGVAGAGRAKSLWTEPGGQAADFDSLIDLITQTVAPKSWEQNGGQGTISPLACHFPNARSPRAGRGVAGRASRRGASDAGRGSRPAMALAGRGGVRAVARREALGRRPCFLGHRRPGPRPGRA